jgi:hypothetical protein
MRSGAACLSQCVRARAVPGPRVPIPTALGLAQPRVADIWPSSAARFRMWLCVVRCVGMVVLFVLWIPAGGWSRAIVYYWFPDLFDNQTAGAIIVFAVFDATCSVLWSWRCLVGSSVVSGISGCSWPACFRMWLRVVWCVCLALLARCVWLGPAWCRGYLAVLGLRASGCGCVWFRACARLCRFRVFQPWPHLTCPTSCCRRPAIPGPRGPHAAASSLAKFRVAHARPHSAYVLNPPACGLHNSACHRAVPHLRAQPTSRSIQVLSGRTWPTCSIH